MKAKFLLLLTAVVPNLMFAQYTGKVFVDSNNDGKYSRGERLKANIMVSDGLNVVKTNSKGEFNLPGHSREKFIFITTPSGYKTYNAFYKPITDDASDYNFAIYPTSGINKDGSHKFIQISDTEIRETQGHDEWITNIKDYSAENDVAFIMHTGDICYPAGMESHIKIMNTRNLDCPISYAIGNHDLVAGEYGEKLYETLYGPVFYSFDAGNVHYIVTPMPSGDYKPSYTNKEVYEWLKNDLANIEEGTPIYVFNHNVASYAHEKIKFKASETESIDLEEKNIKAWLYGHWHVNHITKHGNAFCIGTSTPIRGGIDHTPSSFRVMHINSDGDFTSELRYPYTDVLEINSINMNTIAHENNVAQLSVNVYKTASTVEKLTYQIRSNDITTKKAGALKQNTDWNWSTSFDLSNYTDGDAVTVVVNAYFKNGEVSKAQETFIVNKNTPKISAREDWTNLLKTSAHVGISSDTLSSTLQLKWVQNIGSNIYMTSPIVYNGTVFTASIDENMTGKAAIVAMDAISGTIKWKYTTAHSVKNTIVAESGNIIAQDADGNLYALDAESGTLSWTKKLDVAEVLPATIEGVASKDGIVYAGSGKGLTALDAKTGREIWKNNDWSQNEGCTSTITVTDDAVVMGAQWGGLYANDLATGKKLWGASANGLRNRASSPSFHGGLIYLLSQNNLYVIEPNSGSIAMRKQLPYSVDVTSTPLVTDSEIIFGTASNGVVALDKNTYDEKWNFRTREALIYTSPYVTTPASMIESSPVLSGNTIFVGGLDGTLYALDKKTGALLSSNKFKAPILTTPSISGNALFVCDYAGNVYGFVGEE